jgi:hypothetical protein
VNKATLKDLETGVKVGNIALGTVLYVPSVLYRLLKNIPAALFESFKLLFIAIVATVVYIVLQVISCFKVIPTELLVSDIKSWFAARKLQFNENVTNRFKRTFEFKPMAVKVPVDDG